MRGEFRRRRHVQRLRGPRNCDKSRASSGIFLVSLGRAQDGTGRARILAAPSRRTWEQR